MVSEERTTDIARRWGYDNDAGQFQIKLFDAAPAGRYRIEAKNDHTEETATTDQDARGGDELRVKIAADGGHGVGATVFFDGEKVDTVWAKVAMTTCPHCGHVLA
jgi:predicted DNA-binding WGR domain protein